MRHKKPQKAVPKKEKGLEANEYIFQQGDSTTAPASAFWGVYFPGEDDGTADPQQNTQKITPTE